MNGPWVLSGPPKGLDEVSQKPKCCGPLSLTVKKSWVSHTPVFSPEELGQTSLKCSECKISEAWSEKSYWRLLESSQKEREPRVSVLLSPGIQEQYLETLAPVLGSHLITKLSNDKTKKVSQSFMSFTQRETIHRLRERGVSQKPVEHPSRGIFGKSKF